MFPYFIFVRIVARSRNARGSNERNGNVSNVYRYGNVGRQYIYLHIVTQRTCKQRQSVKSKSERERTSKSNSVREREWERESNTTDERMFTNEQEGLVSFNEKVYHYICLLLNM